MSAFCCVLDLIQPVIFHDDKGTTEQAHVKSYTSQPGNWAHSFDHLVPFPWGNNSPQFGPAVETPCSEAHINRIKSIWNG